MTPSRRIVEIRIWIRLLLVLSLAGYAATASAQQAVLWFSHGRPTPQAIQAVEILGNAASEGLVPQDYDAAQLKEQLGLAISGTVMPADVMVQLDMALTTSMQRYLLDLHRGRLDASQIQRYFKLPRLDYFDAPAYLVEAVANARLPEAVRLAAPRLAQYDLLRTALARYRALLGHPAWQIPLVPLPEKKLEPGQAYAGMDILTRRLIALGDLPPQALMPAMHYYGGAVSDGIKVFQERHGLLPDGIVGAATFKQLEVTPAQRLRQIELTLERLRWTPLTQATRMIVVNIPEFVLRAYEVRNGQPEVQLEMKIIVGRALDTRTPIFQEDMRFIEFSPYWNVPSSITQGEIIPRLRRDPGYFEQQGFELVTPQGQVLTGLSGESLDAVQLGQLRIRQRPGPRNALGDIKFILPNDMNIYLHHTPAPKLFERYRRDFSHGCIRVENPVALARFVLYDEPQWTVERIRAAMGSGASKTIRLNKPVPVLIAYNTVVVKGGKVYFFPDIYNHDAWLDKALRLRARAAAMSSSRNGMASDQHG